MKRYYIYILLLSWVSSSCQNNSAIDTIQDIPKTTKEDQKYASVFKILDSLWKSKFLIFEDQNPVRKDQLDLENISLSSLQKRNLKQINSIDVAQIYTSETSYFQKGTITDYYPNTGQKPGSLT